MFRHNRAQLAAALVGMTVAGVAPHALAQRPLGVDVSSYQGGSINWSSVKSGGISFAWAKATEGTFYIDADFTINESHAKSAGVYIGGYHFAHDEEDIGTAGADAEASYFWNEAHGYLTGGNGYLVPMLDFERTYSTSSYMSDWINEWCQDIKNYAAANGANCNPVVYTDGSIASDLVSPVTNWPLDIADPNGESPQTGAPGVSIGPWPTWTFWQYSWTESVPGISGGVDADVLNGSSTTLQAFLIGTTGTAAGPGVTLDWDPGAKKASPGSGGSGTWNNGTGNWYLKGTGDVAWNASGDYADFAGSAGTVTLGANVEADGITFDTAGYVISGSDTLTLNSPGNINVAPGTPTYITCVLGGVGYNLSGGGVLVLENAGNFSGSGTSAEYVIGPGTCLVVLSDHDAGNSGVTLNLQAGGIYQDNDTTSGDQFLLPGSAIALLTGGGVFDNPNASLSMTNYITGPGSLTFTGWTNYSGTPYVLTLTDTGNNYTGGTIVQGPGELKANAAGVLGSTSGSLTVTGGVLDLGGASHTSGPFTNSGGTTQNGTLTASSFTTQAGTISAVLAGNGALTQNGSGSGTLSGANTYKGITTISAGQINISAENNLGAVPSSTVANQLTFDNNAILRIQNASFAFNAKHGITLLSGGGNLQIASSYTVTYPGVIAGNGSLMMGTTVSTGEGTLILSGANNYSGSTMIACGTLQLGANGALPSGTPLTIESANAGGTFNMNGFSQTIGSLSSGTGIGGTGTQVPTINLTGALTVNQTAGTAFAGVISGSGGSLAIGGSGSLTLSGTNTFSGGTTVNGTATLLITADSGLGAASSGLTLNGGCLKNNNSSPTLSSSRTITLGSSGGYIDAGWGTFGSAGSPVTVGGPITGSGALNIDMDGSPVVLANSGNNFTGGLNIGADGPGYYAPGSCAWLKCGATHVIPFGPGYGDVTINGQTNFQGYLDLNGNSQNINGLNGSGTVTNSTGSATLTVGNNNAAGSFSGQILTGAGSIALAKVGTGTLTLGGVNAYTGNTSVNAGTLALGSGGSINNSPSISIGAGATFDVSAITAYALSGGTALSAGGSALPATINGSTTVNLGSSPIVLSYDGLDPALTISQGTLSLNGNAFTVNGSTLPAGAYVLIQQASGNISSAGSYSVTGTAIPTSGATAAISVTGGTVVLTITDTTTTTLNSFAPSTYGQSVTFTATVAPAPNGGAVQFYDNGIPLGSPMTVSGGTASYSTSLLSAGSHPITASYGGTFGYAASATTGASTQQINPAPLAVTANPQNTTYGQPAISGSGCTNFASVGLQNGDTVGFVTLAISGGGSASNAPVGTYAITPSLATGGTFDPIDYNITYNPGILTVTLPPNTIPVTITSVAQLGDGTVQLDFTGTPGYIYMVEAATNLAAPITWTILSTNAADTNGVFSFIDTDATNYNGRYYQTVAQ